MSFPKTYYFESIQRDIINRQNRKKIFGNKEIKKSGQKGTITLLSSPIILDEDDMFCGHLISKLREDCITRYFRLLDNSVNTYYCFGYKTFGKGKFSSKYLSTGWIKDIERQQKKYIKSMFSLGIGCVPEEMQSISSPMVTRSIRKLLHTYIERGLIKKDMAINYRSHDRQTNISPEDIVWEKTKRPFYRIRYFVDTKNITLIVPTFSPETIFGDVALAVHPEDRRYKKLIGQKAIIPIVNRTIPIIADDSVDISEQEGIKRVTPCHDTWSLNIAKKHNLSLSKFAIDHNGCFTKLAGDFAGKKVGDFFDNIVQNLDDIHNLDAVLHIVSEVPKDKVNGEPLQAILSHQRFFVPPEDIDQQGYMDHILQQVAIYPENYHEAREKSADNMAHSCRSITKKESLGMSFPLREDKDDIYFLSEEIILDMPKNKSKNRKIVPTLLIFNLIADQRLPAHFTIEELVEVIFSSTDKEQSLGELYMDLLVDDLPRGYASEVNEFLKLFVYADKDFGSGKIKSLVNVEKFGDQLMSILEKTACLIHDKGGKYMLDVASIVRSKEDVRSGEEKIDSNLVMSLLAIENSGILTGKEAETTIFMGHEKEKNTIIKTCILGETLQKKLPLQQVFLLPVCEEQKKNIGEELLSKRGADACRLYSIFHDLKKSDSITSDEIAVYSAFVNKVWNACRYIYTTHIETTKKKRKEDTKDIKDIGSYLEKRINKLDPNEYWILSQIKDLYRELPEYASTNRIDEFGLKVMECIRRDFCDKYLEITKIQPTEYTEKVALFCVGVLLQIIHPMAPFFTQALRETFEFAGTIDSQKYTLFLDALTKNYKTQLFMDIIDRFTSLREKLQQPKHQPIDICFHASMDIFHYIRENESTITKLVNAHEIVYITHEKDLQKYELDHIIDVTIGVRVIGKTIKHIDSIETQKHELQRKQERLQEIRHITAQLSLDKKNKKLVIHHKEEMELLKKDIEKLEFEIKKSKMNEK